ncbi:MAG: peptidase S8, partial [Gammaproteobacteria bacterium]|nr:peptidase S8 [Gammaproteobacteria bacterium]
MCSLALGPHSAFAVLVKPAQPSVNGFGLKKAGNMAKAGSSLARVYTEYAAHVKRRAKGPFRPRDRFLQFTNGRIVVDATAATSGAALLADLRRLGLQHGAHYGPVVSGLLPVAAIDRAVALESLQSVSASPQPVRNAGSVTSQGDVALRADVGRGTFSVDGSGVSVGVLSDSYNTLGGAAADVTSGDLPAGVTVLSEYVLCGVLVTCIDEGRAMLQIVHDLAPGSDLLFHTA